MSDGCAKCGLTLTCECERPVDRDAAWLQHTPMGFYKFVHSRAALERYRSWSYLNAWEFAVRIDRERDADTISAELYQALIVKKLTQ